MVVTPGLRTLGAISNPQVSLQDSHRRTLSLQQRGDLLTEACSARAAGLASEEGGALYAQWWTFFLRNKAA